MSTAVSYNSGYRKRNFIKSVLIKVSKFLSTLSRIAEYYAEGNYTDATHEFREFSGLNQTKLSVAKRTGKTGIYAANQLNLPTGAINKSNSMNKPDDMFLDVILKDANSTMPGLDAKIISDIMEEYELCVKFPKEYSKTYLDEVNLKLAKAYSNVYSWYAN